MYAGRFGNKCEHNWTYRAIGGWTPAMCRALGGIVRLVLSSVRDCSKCGSVEGKQPHGDWLEIPSKQIEVFD